MLAERDSTTETEMLASLVPAITRIARGLGRVYHFEEYADLYQDGCIGALRAIRAFEAGKGNELETFARPIIAGEVINAIRERDPLSRRARKMIRNAETVRKQMEIEGRTSPTLDELTIKVRGLGGALLAARRAEGIFEDPERVTKVEPAIDTDEQPAEIAAKRDQVIRLHRALSRLEPRLRSVIAAHYYGDRSIVQIGRRMNISSQRVTQLRTTALRRMRTELGTRVQ